MANSLFILSTFHRISLSSYHRNSQITKPQFVHKYCCLKLNIKVFTNQTVAFFDKRPVYISQNLVAKLHDFHIEFNGLKVTSPQNIFIIFDHQSPMNWLDKQESQKISWETASCWAADNGAWPMWGVTGVTGGPRCFWFTSEQCLLDIV